MRRDKKKSTHCTVHFRVLNSEYRYILKMKFLIEDRRNYDS